MNNPINKQDSNGQYATNVFGTEFTIKAVITTIVWSVMATKILHDSVKQTIKNVSKVSKKKKRIH